MTTKRSASPISVSVCPTFCSGADVKEIPEDGKVIYERPYLSTYDQWEAPQEGTPPFRTMAKPVLTAVNSRQVCQAPDPATSINANINGVLGDLAMQSLSMGNSFEADSNAQNMPIRNSQLNNSFSASSINANAFNIGGSMSMTSAAIGNKAQILHYSTAN